MRSRPLVSVLLTAYNHAAFAHEAITSVLAQRGPFDLEVIYCDDASADSTPSIARLIEARDPRLKVVLRESNIGLISNFLDGLNRCRGDYVAYCDGDDFWIDTNKLERQLKALQQNPECTFSFHDVLLSDSQSALSSRWSVGRENEHWATGVKAPEEFLSPTLIVFHATSVLFRSDAIEAEFLEKIDRKFTGLDYAVASMLGSKGAGYYFTDAMASYRKHHSSMSARRDDPIKLQSLLREIELLEGIINEYYGERFRDFTARNRWGHLVNVLYELAGLAKERRSLKCLGAFISEGGAAVFNKAIGLRDLLYIARTQFFSRSTS